MATSPTSPSFFPDQLQLQLQVSSTSPSSQQLGQISLPSLSSEVRPTQLGVAEAAAAPSVALTRVEEAVGVAIAGQVGLATPRSGGCRKIRFRGGAPQKPAIKPGTGDNGGEINDVVPQPGIVRDQGVGVWFEVAKV
ncbi:hypothetical protein GUJ93_ZPchr0008g11478 [Zizania palustris]|uniref:Uncharacterized protein n=1 Tax=Zizania palustris TaxID=103762 RepID=A0A8J5RVX1_ZIZPA|nr:hypothetical protein GUJ93_ZPchr0008g11478 [Zizania palustris]